MTAPQHSLSLRSCAARRSASPSTIWEPGSRRYAYLSDFRILENQDRSANFRQNARSFARVQSAIIKGHSPDQPRAAELRALPKAWRRRTQLERMRGFGINAMQGYLFSKPLPRAPAPRTDRRADYPAARDLGRSARRAATGGGGGASRENCILINCSGKQPLKHRHPHEFRQADLLEIHRIRQRIARRVDLVETRQAGGRAAPWNGCARSSPE